MVLYIGTLQTCSGQSYRTRRFVIRTGMMYLMSYAQCACLVTRLALQVTFRQSCGSTAWGGVAMVFQLTIDRPAEVAANNADGL